jgi:uncharacterized protein
MRWIGAIAGLLAGAAGAQTAVPVPQAVPATDASPFTYREVMVPMRDGARLQTVILVPKARAGRLPILLVRTPYGVPAEAPRSMPKSWAALARDGYIFVEQSMRGQAKSDGTFTLSTAVHPDGPKAVDEATDAYDTIDWLVKNLAEGDGKVGMFGVSYPGFAAAVALAKPHPALKAVSPQAAWIDYWQNDDLHRNGALRLSYATDWLYSLQASKTGEAFAYPVHDTYDWFLRQGSVATIDREVFKGRVPMFTALVEHPNHDAFYTGQRWSDTLGRTTVPTLNVAGYWDQEDPWGSWQIYARQQRDDRQNLAQMVAGPWAHGWWSRPGTDRLGRIPYGVDSSTQFLEQVQAPFFAWWLHGKGKRPDWEVKSFQSGSWTWRSYAAWPAPGAVATNLYLRADGSLSFAAPAADEGCRQYVSDPANPVPFRPRPMSATYRSPDWQWWEAEDQRFVGNRPDVLSWTSAPLDADLTVTGEVAATLFASTTGTDADMVVKLIDVYPEDAEPLPARPEPGQWARSLNGYQLPVAMEVRRGRFLTSDTAPQPLVPGQVTEWPVPMRAHDHVFRKGHRLMVQVQSSWFPVIDRNPQTFVTNPYKAAPADFVTTTQRVCSAPGRASHVALPVMRRPADGQGAQR